MKSTFRNLGGLGTILTGIMFAAIAVLQPNNFPLPDSWNNKAIIGFCVSVDIALAGPFMLWSRKRNRPLIDTVAAMLPLGLCLVFSTVAMLLAIVIPYIQTLR